MLALAVACALGAAGLADLATEFLVNYIHVPWTVAALLFALAVAILAAAWPVRQYVKGKRRQVDQLRAATVLALAKACTLAGASLAGVYLGLVLVAVLGAHSPAAWTRVALTVAAAAGATALAVSGRVAEWFCRLPPEDLGTNPV
jgi:hypothetical protein